VQVIAFLPEMPNRSASSALTTDLERSSIQQKSGLNERLGDDAPFEGAQEIESG
jgi:hypothetical protein